MMEFRTRRNGFDSTRNRLITLMTIMMVVIIGIVAGPDLLSGNQDAMMSSFMTIILLGLTSAFTVFFTLKKQKEQFLSFILVIDESGITRKSLVLPSVTIRSNEVVKIVRVSDGSLMITGTQINHRIAVPAQMENYDQMIELLQEIKPITHQHRNYQALSKTASFGMLALLAVDYLVQNRIANIISYSLTVVALIASLVIIQRSSSVERRIKLMSWLILIPLLAFLSTLIALIQS